MGKTPRRQTGKKEGIYRRLLRGADKCPVLVCDSFNQGSARPERIAPQAAAAPAGRRNRLGEHEARPYPHFVTISWFSAGSQMD